MRDLKVYEIPLEKVTLERINPTNKRHKKAIFRMRDYKAKKMMYDVKYIFEDAIKNKEIGNSFLLKDKGNYIGYIYISNQRGDERGISYMIEKSVRNKGYGKIVLTSVSDYLFKEGLANSLVLYIKDKNKSSINVAEKCGFNRNGTLSNTKTSIYKKYK